MLSGSRCRQHTHHALEFLVNAARPKGFSQLNLEAGKLPSSVQFRLHLFKKGTTAFPTELCSFSLFLPIQQFEELHCLNFLQARSQVLYYLQLIFGQFRDYNGGLFESQKAVISNLSFSLSDKIPHFSLFADKFFHNLQPVEARFTLANDELEKMLRAVSALFDQPEKENYISKNDKKGCKNNFKNF